MRNAISSASFKAVDNENRFLSPNTAYIQRIERHRDPARMRRLFAIGRDELKASTDEIIDVLGVTLDASLHPIQQHISGLGLALCHIEVKTDQYC